MGRKLHVAHDSMILSPRRKDTAPPMKPAAQATATGWSTKSLPASEVMGKRSGAKREGRLAVFCGASKQRRIWRREGGRAGEQERNCGAALDKGNNMHPGPPMPAAAGVSADACPTGIRRSRNLTVLEGTLPGAPPGTRTCRASASTATGTC